MNYLFFILGGKIIGFSKRKILLYLIYLFIFITASFIFFNLRHYRRSGGDSGEMVLLVSHLPSYRYYYRSPGIFFLHQTTYFLFRPYGLTGENAVAISSSLAGGIFFCVLIAFSIHPFFLILNLFSGIVFIFTGHLENYGMMNAILAYCFLTGKRYLEGKGSFSFAVFIWLLASFMHMLGIFYLPAVLYLFLRPSKIFPLHSHEVSNADLLVGTEIIESRFKLPSQKQIEISILIIIIFAIIITFVPLVMKDRVFMLDVGMLRLVPLFKITNPRHYFTMFSLEHFKILLYFIRQSSILGIPLLILLIPQIKSKTHIFILAGFLSGFLWAFIWHPDMGYGDWDLFGSFAIPLNLLVGLLLSEIFPMPTLEKFHKKFLLS